MRWRRKLTFYYSHAVAQTIGDNLVLDVTLEIEGEIALRYCNPGYECVSDGKRRFRPATK
jgi:hypothetical protein